jgi:hypothetical protein
LFSTCSSYYSYYSYFGCLKLESDFFIRLSLGRALLIFLESEMRKREKGREGEKERKREREKDRQRDRERQREAYNIACAQQPLHMHQPLPRQVSLPALRGWEKGRGRGELGAARAILEGGRIGRRIGGGLVRKEVVVEELGWCGGGSQRRCVHGVCEIRLLQVEVARLCCKRRWVGWGFIGFVSATHAGG